MKIGVSLKIDVTKIDKEKLFKGSRGTYLDATVFINIDEKDKYENNGMITQAVQKDSQEKGNILGNCKIFWSDSSSQQAVAQTPAPPPQGQPMGVSRQPAASFDDDIPW